MYGWYSGSKIRQEQEYVQLKIGKPYIHPLCYFCDIVTIYGRDGCRTSLLIAGGILVPVYLFH